MQKTHQTTALNNSWKQEDCCGNPAMKSGAEINVAMSRRGCKFDGSNNRLRHQ
jgi:hypothetical protein